MRKVTVFILLAASACGPPDATADADTSGGEVELGTGAVAFEPLAAEQRLGLWMGPQGGYHFVVHARIRMMTPGDPTEPVTTPSTRFLVFREDGRQVDKQNPAYRIAYDDTGDGWFTLPGGRIAQIENAEVPDIYEQRVRIRVEVRDEVGRTASDERWVVAYDYCNENPEACSFGRPAP